MKIIREFKEGVLWLFIFLSPLITGLLAALTVFANGNILLAYIILGIAAISGIFFAEWVRKHYGCANYLSELFHHKEE